MDLNEITDQYQIIAEVKLNPSDKINLPMPVRRKIGLTGDPNERIVFYLRSDGLVGLCRGVLTLTVPNQPYSMQLPG